MFFQSKKLIGLDIGTANIKLAEIDFARKGSTLVNFVIGPTPPKAITGAEIADPGAVSSAIKQLVARLHSKRKASAAALWGSSVITKRISIPRMDENLVAGQIRWEAEQYIPFDINDVNVDFKLLKKYSANHPETLDVLLVAARQEIAVLYQDIVQSSGLQCAVIDVGGFALANCFLNNVGPVAGKVVALMNFGAAVTNFVVLDGEEVIFCRDIPVGGLTYTGEIQKNMGISMEEAEAMKISACTGQATPDEVTKLIESVHEMVADEVQSSLDFFTNTTPGVQVEQCYVSGGASRTTGLLTHLGQHTKVAYEILDPFRNVKINSKSLNHEFVAEIRDFASVAVGLGMRAIGDT